MQGLLPEPGAVEPIIWPILGALAGLVAGSFLATLVLRWPRGEALTGRSRCDSCGVQLAARDLVPLLSWAFSGAFSGAMSRGRCRHCGARIDWRHPAIEGSAALVGALALFTVPGPAGFAGALFGWILLALLALDAEHFWLPDALTLPLLALGLLLGPGTLPERLLAAAVAGGGLLVLALAYKALRGRDGLGLGDVKLMAALGAWLSLALIGPLMLLAALTGLVLAFVARLRRKAPGAPGTAGTTGEIPFGACLAAAGFALWLVANGPGFSPGFPSFGTG